MSKLSHGADKNKVSNMPITAHISVDKGFVNLSVKGSRVSRGAKYEEIKLVRL